MATESAINGLAPGAVAYVRSRQYVVEDVRPGTEAWESPLVRLSCLADDALGERLEVLWNHEIDARIVDVEGAWADAGKRGYDEPQLFSACCPPSVVTQWREEMEQRFVLTFAVYDREFVARTRQERGYAVNPWSTHTRFILSQALLRDETYAALLRSWLGAFAHDAILILDEAHNAAPASASPYAIDSHLTQAVRDLAFRFEHRLFLSATPHNGYSNSFAALLEVLAPQRFCRGVPVKNAKLLDDVMVRRLKQYRREVGEAFPKRHVDPIVLSDVPAWAPDLVLSRLLQDYRQLRDQRLAGATKRRRAAAMLDLTSHQKRLLSSIEAFARTLEIHRKCVVREAAEAPEPSSNQVELFVEPPGSDDERADLPEVEVLIEEDAALAGASAATGGPAAQMAAELKVLDQMRAIANDARHRTDARMVWLLDCIRQNQCPDLGKPGARWLERRLLIFTEYTDTKRYLQTQLEPLVESSDLGERRVGVFHGGMGDERREEIKAAFNADPAHHPLRILIATDAAREGVNLQNHCADLIHFDIPWNPGRMEQRNGRIDRKLQRAQEVWCRYFVLPGRAEDRVLDVLVRKTALIHEELGSLSAVVTRRVERLLEGGIPHEDEADLRTRLGELDAKGKDPGEAGRVVEEELEAKGGHRGTPRRPARDTQFRAVTPRPPSATHAQQNVCSPPPPLQHVFPAPLAAPRILHSLPPPPSA